MRFWKVKITDRGTDQPVHEYYFLFRRSANKFVKENEGFLIARDMDCMVEWADHLWLKSFKF